MAKQPNRKKKNPKHKKRTSQGGGAEEPFYQGVPRKRNSPKVQAKQQRRHVDPEEKKEVRRQERDPRRQAKGLRPDEAIRLNRFIAQAGVCSRREADNLISTGKIKVNEKVVTELSTRVVPERDKVEYRGRILTPQNFVYYLFNKPKNMITTMSDPLGRKTV
ncbi:MAG: S4 domain-containing protein, partial [Bacteroidota bacterium]